MKTNIYWINIESNIGSGKTTLLNNLSHDPQLNVFFSNRGSLLLLNEPIDDWTELLKEFYTHPHLYAGVLQTHTSSTLFKRDCDVITNLRTSIQITENEIQHSKLLRYLEQNPCEDQKKNEIKTYVVITERSLSSSHNFFVPLLLQQGYISELEAIFLINNSKLLDNKIISLLFSLTRRGCEDKENYRYAPTSVDVYLRTLYLRTSPEINLKRLKSRSSLDHSIQLNYLTNLHRLHEMYFQKQDDNCGKAIHFIDATVSENEVLSTVRQYILNIV
jgi:hypothetical protein